MSLVFTRYWSWGHSGLCITGHNVSASCHSVPNYLPLETKPAVCRENLAAKNCPIVNLSIKKY
ncbi:hypothetical protein X971_0510 [Agrobacterium tumefaciens LBA4213 (Ach5)]|nr:hypothetical protein X971_0510 [Agrobacterium tumefaciens LBA4213 (Ach5)]